MQSIPDGSDIHSFTNSVPVCRAACFWSFGLAFETDEGLTDEGNTGYPFLESRSRQKRVFDCVSWVFIVFCSA